MDITIKNVRIISRVLYLSIRFKGDTTPRKITAQIKKVMYLLTKST